MRIKVLLPILLIALSGVHPAAADQPLFTLHEVGPGVWAAISPDGSKAGANTGFVIGQDGVAVIDSFQNVDAARQLLADIRQRTSLPIRFLINTHYHLDHMMGNGVFAAAGAVIVANRNVRAWAHTENLKFFGPSPTAANRALVDAIVLPSLVYDRGVDLYLGNTGAGRPAHAGPHRQRFDRRRARRARRLHRRPAVGPASAEPDRRVDEAVAPVAGLARDALSLGDLRTGSRRCGAARGPPWRSAAIWSSCASRWRTGSQPASRGRLSWTTLAPAFRSQYGTWGFFEHFLTPNILQTADELQGNKRLPGGRIN